MDMALVVIELVLMHIVLELDLAVKKELKLE